MDKKSGKRGSWVVHYASMDAAMLSDDIADRTAQRMPTNRDRSSLVGTSDEIIDVSRTADSGVDSVDIQHYLKVARQIANLGKYRTTIADDDAVCLLIAVDSVFCVGEMFVVVVSRDDMRTLIVLRIAVICYIGKYFVLCRYADTRDDLGLDLSDVLYRGLFEKFDALCSISSHISQKRILPDQIYE